MRQWSGPCQHWAHVAHTRGAPLSTSSCSPPVVEAGRSATQRSGLPSRALHLALAVPAPSPCSRHATNGAPTGKRFSGPRPRRRLRGAERPGRRGRLGAPCQLGSRAGSRAHLWTSRLWTRRAWRAALAVLAGPPPARPPRAAPAAGARPAPPWRPRPRRRRRATRAMRTATPARPAAGCRLIMQMSRWASSCMLLLAHLRCWRRPAPAVQAQPVPPVLVT